MYTRHYGANREQVISWCVVIALGTVMLMVSDLAAAEPASQPLRYGGKNGQTVAYEVEVNADHDDYVDVMKGVITYTIRQSGDDQLKLEYHGGLHRTKKTKPGRAPQVPFGPRFRRPFGPGSLPRGPRSLFGNATFTGLGSQTNDITLTPTGAVQTITGSSQLPYLLGNLSVLVFEPLPDDYRKSWSVGQGITISEKNERQFGPPSFAHSPFSRQDQERQTAGLDKISFTIESDDGRLVTTSRSYQLTSPKTDGKSFKISASGKWCFNRALAVSETLDVKQTLTVQDGNTTVTIPMTIKYRRLSEAELEQHRQEQQKRMEEAKKRLAEMQKKRQARDKTGTDSSRHRRAGQARKPEDILADLQSKNTARVIGALHRLHRNPPEKPDSRVNAAVEVLLHHENRMVRQWAEKVHGQ